MPAVSSSASGKYSAAIALGDESAHFSTQDLNCAPMQRQLRARSMLHMRLCRTFGG